MLDSGFSLRAFPTSHTIHSQGYCLYTLRKKLRQDLQVQKGGKGGRGKGGGEGGC